MYNRELWMFFLSLSSMSRLNTQCRKRERPQEKFHNLQAQKLQVIIECVHNNNKHHF